MYAPHRNFFQKNYITLLQNHLIRVDTTRKKALLVKTSSKILLFIVSRV